MGDAPLLLLLHHPRRSTERRLRKMSQEFPPAAFAFCVQARVLCVGMAVVYRVAITVSTTASWAVATPSRSQPQNQSQNQRATSHDWVVAMSQSKLRAFYSHARAILEQPAVLERRSHQHLMRASDGSNTSGSAGDDDADSSGDTWQPFEHFLLSIADVLDQYEHLQSAFAVQACVEAMYEGRVALEAFLVDCWRALEAVIPSLAVEPHLPAAAALGREVVCVYVLLRDLLAFPESILEANCVYASAILGLEDVEELLPPVAAHVCSICLERLTCAAMRELDPEAATGGSCRNDGDNGECDDDVACARSGDRSQFSVRLPCAHLFHENCVMAWLRHNPSCPECRASVVGER
ncbi:hypothetical protein PybrP1_010765 [[Pythium] brassicae (nom. inval.)]|nr:hypothetical protein PybrP1_010765 [[Pythium] brassicae (nom. inval.)]